SNEQDESLAFIDRLLGKLRKERIWAVDLGCGNGRYMLRYQGATKGRLIGADFSISGLRGIREIDSSADLAVADVMGLPFRDGVLDVVLMVGVVYEIEDLDMHRERSLLRSGGCSSLEGSVCSSPIVTSTCSIAYTPGFPNTTQSCASCWAKHRSTETT
ncbi:MAG: class I SAM-dependent methyltransferase, partial [Candidatus Latescibacterota bacterium]